MNSVPLHNTGKRKNITKINRVVKPDSHVAQLDEKPFEVALQPLGSRQLANNVFQSFLGVDARPETTKLDLNCSPGNAMA